jgi:hypothetical protein
MIWRNGRENFPHSADLKVLIGKVHIDYMHVWLSCVDSRVNVTMSRGAAEGE